MPRPDSAYTTDWSNDKRVQLLRELVEINSGTLNIAGVNRVQEIVAARMREIGLVVRLEENELGPQYSGRFLIADLPSSRPSTPLVTLVSHADTVFEPESGFVAFTLDEVSARAGGPGAIDDKGGIVVAWEGLKRWIERTPEANRRIRLRFLCAPNEETGSPGFHRLLKKLGQESWMALGFEPALEDGSIVRSRKGNRWYHVQIRGRAAHSGRNVEQGVNAAHELAFKLIDLQRLNDPSQGISLSTGSFQGGERGKFNIVCAEAEARLDVRFQDFESRERIHGEIEKILSRSHIGPASDGLLPRASYTIADDCPPFMDSGTAQRYVAQYVQLIESLENRKIGSESCGGAADVNYMSHPELLIIDGLGAYGSGMHRRDEQIELSSLETRSEALARFLNQLNDSQGTSA